MISILMASTAVFMGGNELYGYCTGDASGQVACLGYVSGVADGIAVSQLVNETAPYQVCIPQNAVSKRQLMDIVVRFMTDHPETRHITASFQVHRALSEAFPCA